MITSAMALISGLTDFDVKIMLMTIITSIALIVILAIFNYFFKPDKRKAFIGKWINGMFQVIQVKKVTPFTKKIPITKGSTNTTILFDISKPTFRTKRNTWVYIVDIDKAQVLLNPQEFKVPNWEYDMALTRGTVKNVMSGINKPQVANMLIFILLGILAGLPIGVMIGKLII